MGKYKVLTDRLNTYFTSNKITIGTASPTSGAHAAGDIVISKSANANAFGWICVSSGSPGSWKVLKSGHDITKAEVEKVLTGVITSHTHNYAASTAAGGAANSAVKLQTARTLTVGNSGKSFDGTGNVSWTLSEIGAAAASHSHGYLPLSGGTMTNSITNNLTTGTWIDGAKGKALLTSTAAGSGFVSLISTKSTNGAFTINQYNGELNVSYMTNTNISNGTNNATYTARLLNEAGNTNFPGTVSAPKFSGSLSGNASTATTLATARTINGTSFNGSGNITTANWGTARNITIGNITRSVNGSTNVAWTIGDIGAAAASHKHSMADITAGNTAATATGSIYFNNAGKTHVGRLSCYNNTSTGDYVSLGLYDVADSNNVSYMTIYKDHMNINKPIHLSSSYMELNGNKFSISTSAPSGPSTGDIWIDI